MLICLLNEFFDDISAGLPEKDYAVNKTFPRQGFVSAFVYDLLFDLPHENWNEFSFKISPCAFASKRLGMRGVSL